MRPTSIVKAALVIVFAAASLSCGESKKERAQRESEEADRQTLLEIQRQENIQRQADRDQKTIENVIKGIDIITR
jgi:hypothetical protein